MEPSPLWCAGKSLPTFPALSPPRATLLPQLPFTSVGNSHQQRNMYHFPYWKNKNKNTSKAASLEGIPPYSTLPNKTPEASTVCSSSSLCPGRPSLTVYSRWCLLPMLFLVSSLAASLLTCSGPPPGMYLPCLLSSPSHWDVKSRQDRHIWLFFSQLYP